MKNYALAALLMLSGAYIHQQLVNNGIIRGQLHVTYDYGEGR